MDSFLAGVPAHLLRARHAAAICCWPSAAFRCRRCRAATAPRICSCRSSACWPGVSPSASRWRSVSGLRDVGVAGAYLLAPAVWILLPYRTAQVEAGLKREYLPGMRSRASKVFSLRLRVSTPTCRRRSGAHSQPNPTPSCFQGCSCWCWRPLRSSAVPGHSADARGHARQLDGLLPVAGDRGHADVHRLAFRVVAVRVLAAGPELHSRAVAVHHPDDAGAGGAGGHRPRSPRGPRITRRSEPSLPPSSPCCCSANMPSIRLPACPSPSTSRRSIAG